MQTEIRMRDHPLEWLKRKTEILSASEHTE